MARPVSVNLDKLLAAARGVFLRRGISGTTAEVARRAGVAEGSIFNRFPSKLALFQAALRPALDEPPWLADLHARVGRGDLRRHLRDIGEGAIAFFEHVLPLVLMSWSSKTGALPLAGPDPPPLRALRRIAGFLAAEMRAGRVRKQDPEILARAFLGALANYVLTQLVLAPRRALQRERRAYVAGLVDALWHGAEPRKEKS